nr:MAG TPA: hypothetical protein [Caudoviricetes sp.]
MPAENGIGRRLQAERHRNLVLAHKQPNRTEREAVPMGRLFSCPETAGDTCPTIQPSRGAAATAPCAAAAATAASDRSAQ